MDMLKHALIVLGVGKAVAGFENLVEQISVVEARFLLNGFEHTRKATGHVFLEVVFFDPVPKLAEVVFHGACFC